VGWHTTRSLDSYNDSQSDNLCKQKLLKYFNVETKIFQCHLSRSEHIKSITRQKD